MTIAVVGASGLVGAAAVDAFLEAGENVLAISRRTPELLSDRQFEHLPLDLLDAEATEAALAARTDITHVVYAAVYELANLVRGWSSPDQMDANLTMIRNALTPIIAGGSLRQVTLLQGTKAYGAHLHPIRVPSRESEPRDDHVNFYWMQEDYIREQSEQHEFVWTIFRPPLIVGPTHGVAMNLIPVIGVYAAMRGAEGMPFTYPGGPSYVAEAVDVALLAEAIVWAASARSAQNQIFNISNGEVFQWRDVWPGMATTLGIETGPDEAFRISEYLLAREDLWREIVKKRGLRKLTLLELFGKSHLYADFQFAAMTVVPPPPALMSVVKLHQAGFHGVRNTEQSFQRWLQVLVDRRIIPHV